MSRWFDWKWLSKRVALATVAGLASLFLCGGQPVRAAIRLNEIYLDSPGGGDDDEYFEIRGTSTDSLADVWFIQLENERGAMTAVPGVVDFAYELSSFSFASSNYLWFAQSGEDYPASRTGTYSGNTIENGGGTFLLVDTNGVGTDPAVGHQWDSNDDGVFDTNWNAGWTILDAIGVFATSDDITGTNDGRLYADINFAAGVTTGIDAEGKAHATGGSAIAAAKINTDRAALNGSGANANAFDEIEYLGRYGDSTSMGVGNVDDWIAANLTDDPASGYTVPPNNYGVSGNHDDLNEPEVVRGDNVVAPFSYGTDVTVTLGSQNIHAPEPGSAILMLLAAGASLIQLQRRRARV